MLLGVFPKKDATKLKVKHNALDLTAAFSKVSGGSNVLILSLDSSKAVTVDGQSIKVRPELTNKPGDDVIAEAPFAVKGNKAAIGVKTIPGLKYTLLRGSTLEELNWAAPHEFAPVTATGTCTKLEDNTRPNGAAFYKVQVATP